MAGRLGTIAGTCLVFCASLCAGGCGKKSALPTVTIAKGTWTVELALNGEQRYRGLSGRDKLGENEGMLFIYPEPRILDFCMRGCHIPLDIAFIGPDRRVVKTHTMAVEADMQGRATYSSTVPAQYALEVPAGSLQRASVKVGDEVSFSAAIPEPAKARPGP